MDRKARTRETTVNDYLAAALNSRHPRWSVEAESTRVLWVGLADRPETVAQSLEVASAILNHRVSGDGSGELPGVLRIGDQRLGIVGTGRLEDGTRRIVTRYANNSIRLFFAICLDFPSRYSARWIR